jgi:uncharacterized cupredoxin-like copper-binding protein
MFWKKFVVPLVTGLLLAACGGGQGGAETVEVNVTLTEFGFESSVTEFRTGIPYRFVVTNVGAVNHEFMIMPPLSEDQMGMAMDMHELDETALAMIEEDELLPGVTKSLEYTFTETAPSGTLEFACHTPGHYEAGMKLPITVR